MKKVELLAPAGSFDSMYAAVNNGADALYLGGDKFSARAYASNFDKENMKKAVDYIHLYGVKIYVTINTLIKESEIEEALKYAEFLYGIGVDALLIQDLGLLRAIRKSLPDFELHASTQMTVHNLEGALFLKEQGIKRIVLSRELSLKEIKYISENLGAETEIFVHGALCVCYSGMCLMSSMIGGRSGNRGRCAQSCRLPYTLKSLNSNKEYKGYLLSPKDICSVDNVKDLIDTGTSSLKIEGRMKRPEYVAGVVREYRKAIDEVKNSSGKNTLMKLFNREGFSKAYLYKNEGRDMMAFKFPKNTGVLLGKADEKLEVLLQEDLAIKDGVRIGEQGFIVSKIQVGEEIREKAQKGEKVRIFPKQYSRGDYLYKTADAILLKELSQTYSNIYGKKIDLHCKVNFMVEKTLELTVFYNEKLYSVKGELVQRAEKKPLSRERIQDALNKSGDSPFKISTVEFENFEDGFMAISSLNEARRKLIEEIEFNEINKHKRVTENKRMCFNEHFSGQDLPAPEMLFTANTKEQLTALVEGGAKDIGVNLYNKNKKGITLEDIKGIRGTRIYLKVPNIIKGEYDALINEVGKKLSLFSGIITANLGIIRHFKGKTKIISDYKSNIFNSEAVKFFKENGVYPYLSQELNKKEIMDILSRVKDVGLSVYGKTEVMVSEYCPVGSSAGGKGTGSSCSMPCTNEDFILKDRMNKEFSIMTDKFCRSYIYNSSSLNLIGEIRNLKEKGITSFRFDFTDETEEDVRNIIKSINDSSYTPKGEYTKGHYKRGVE